MCFSSAYTKFNICPRSHEPLVNFSLLLVCSFGIVQQVRNFIFSAKFKKNQLVKVRIYKTMGICS